MRRLVHFAVAIDAVELAGEFVIEECVVESFGNGFVLNVGFEEVAAAEVPGGVEDEFEEIELAESGGLQFVEEGGFELIELGLFVGADEDFGGGESGGGGVGGGGALAFVGARSGGELGVGAVGLDL